MDLNLTNSQTPIVVSSNTTAVNDRNYTVVANATFTDPSPVEGKGFKVFVRNGTAVIGGTSYSANSLVFRIFHSGAWSNTLINVDLSGLVPYTGATADVDLGEFELKAGQVELDQTPTGTAGVAVMRWNDTDGTIDLGLKGGNVTLQVGQEQVLRVVNKTATNVNLLEANYQAVRVTGAQGQRLKVDLAQATTDALSAETIGLVTETINNNQEGFITTSGIVRNINTTGSLQSETWADGDVVYLSPTTAGRITNIKPSAPNHLVIIGCVVSAHATQGSIFVKVDNGYELGELHNVLLTSPANNDALVYETASLLWKNKPSIPTERTITINGTTQDLSADSTYSAVLLSGQPNAANTGVSGVLRYFGFSNNIVSASENLRRIFLPNACTLKNFYIRTSSVQPATGSHVLTILKNGVATSIVVTIAAGSAAGVFSDTTNSVSFAAGDEISIQAVNNATANSGGIIGYSIGNL